MAGEALEADAGELVADEDQSIKQAARKARNEYEAVRGLYEDFAASLSSILNRCISENNLTVHSVTYRAKNPESFERKATQSSTDSPSLAKYRSPMQDIADKAGVRIITYFLSTVEEVSKIITGEFDVLEKDAKVSNEPDRLGYQSTHYLVSYPSRRIMLPEYKRFAGLVAEIQVRTILQHAWAEIEHDIQYKAVATLPSRIRRRFAALAGLIEIADREFQAIQIDDREISEEARRNVGLGQLDQVEITRDSLRAYLNRKYGADGRMSDFSYNWSALLLIKLGFSNLAEVDECVDDSDDNKLSRIVYGSRQGQLTRFELVLLAKMGMNFIHAHPWAEEDDTPWFVPRQVWKLRKIRESGIELGNYRPPGYPEPTVKALGLTEGIDLNSPAGEE